MLITLAVISLSLVSRGVDKKGVLDISQQTEQNTKPEKVSTYDHVSIQAAIDKWIAGNSGDYAVIVRDVSSNQVLGQYNSDEEFFSASIYKLYIAMLGYIDIDNGALDDADLLVGTQSLGECLDLMVRESDSPCGEALLARYDRSDAQDRLEQLGILGIDINGFTITASGVDALLSVISDRGISDLEESMRRQVYDKGLRAAFSSYEVLDKVGFSPDDWHDVGFIDGLQGGRVSIVVLSRDAGSSGVRSLGEALRKSLEFTR